MSLLVENNEIAPIDSSVYDYLFDDQVEMLDSTSSEAVPIVEMSSPAENNDNLLNESRGAELNSIFEELAQIPEDSTFTADLDFLNKYEPLPQEAICRSSIDAMVSTFQPTQEVAGPLTVDPWLLTNQPTLEAVNASINQNVSGNQFGASLQLRTPPPSPLAENRQFFEQQNINIPQDLPVLFWRHSTDHPIEFFTRRPRDQFLYPAEVVSRSQGQVPGTPASLQSPVSLWPAAGYQKVDNSLAPGIPRQDWMNDKAVQLLADISESLNDLLGNPVPTINDRVALPSNERALISQVAPVTPDNRGPYGNSCLGRFHPSLQQQGTSFPSPGQLYNSGADQSIAPTVFSRRTYPFQSPMGLQHLPVSHASAYQETGFGASPASNPQSSVFSSPCFGNPHTVQMMQYPSVVHPDPQMETAYSSSPPGPSTRRTSASTLLSSADAPITPSSGRSGRGVIPTTTRRQAEQHPPITKAWNPSKVEKPKKGRPKGSRTQKAEYDGQGQMIIGWADQQYTTGTNYQDAYQGVRVRDEQGNNPRMAENGKLRRIRGPQDQ